ncbi:MAG: repair protein RecO protein [Candidatus Amesbacteria bacterium GW2011_GWA2_47_11b]|uniref:DNA repair protein RecO n=3 Tax=Candidatus Amesiibacteriota TaxID=1752730 RepID=A0A0G1SH48_9BACT|nr:MAG: repair protein RecO protein [Microgenomates group bacterium GW2011_GWC1_46_20]KKU58614.1 MAG: repair protein RecO protein [Candidatus Amesbacteria bacterium GW2011_GWA2_47_11b]KKU68762.1 MAG: repair protein RecO protein [Candidatus Amesbacteria bacterium GW2011_GWA1_47_20]KKU83757.1 MAG: repair protein RecO protein [Candidatus Amesbacteria bacterium GW2011_GWC2_47_8]
MNSYSDRGVVLKRSNLGEADKLITFYTKNHGKVAAVARGLRKPTSKRAGSLELFNEVKVSFIKGKGELDTLAEVQILETYSGWRKHLGRVNLAYQLVEVIDKLTPDHQPHQEIFEILRRSLSEIGNLKIDWKLKIENWKLQLLRELGYWPRTKDFTGEVDQFIESLINRPLNSPKLLNRLK